MAVSSVVEPAVHSLPTEHGHQTQDSGGFPFSFSSLFFPRLSAHRRRLRAQRSVIISESRNTEHNRKYM